MNMESISRLDQLTGLRYFAALLVFCSHLQWKGSSEVLIKVFESGYAGVSFFFLLSGFVLSFSYAEKISSRSLGLIRYMLLRFARLTPLHFLTAAPFVVMGIYNSNLDMTNTVLNILLLQSWIPESSYYFSLNAPSWSLSNEIFFYLCFFPLILILSRHLLWIACILFSVILIAAV
ncbi:MAG: acyltransferase, partial [Magnetococcales bacterium]|nr:acyltransferase [Magnetococcales bacterium]